METGPVQLQGITINAAILETLQGFSTNRNVLKGITIGVGTGASIMQMKVVDKNHEPIEGATCRVLNAIGGSNNVPDLDGVDDYMSVAHNTAFEPLSMTWEFLVYVDAWFATTGTFLMSKRTATTNGISVWRLNSTGGLIFDYGGSGTRWATGYIPPTGEWLRITVTRTSSGRKLYVNGSLEKQTTSAGGTTMSTGVLAFGKDVTGNSLFLNGRMSDVRIWNIERTPESIAADWNKRLEGNEANLVEYWKMDEGTGTVINAMVNIGNNGTVFGATWAEAEESFPLFGPTGLYYTDEYDSQTTNANGLCTLNYQINNIHGLEVTLPGKRRFIMPFERTTRGFLDWQVMLSDYLATFATDKGNILINSEPENNDANFLIE